MLAQLKERKMRVNVLGKTVFAQYKHHIMKANLDDIQYIQRHDLALVQVPNKDAAKIIDAGTTLSKRSLEWVIKNNTDRCELFILVDQKGNAVGTVGVMFKGGNDPEYLIRNIDAYIFGVFIQEAYRGNGYAGCMLGYLAEHLKDKHIQQAHMAVNIHNKSAIRSYEKAGFQIADSKTFCRFFRINIPYHKL